MDKKRSIEEQVREQLSSIRENELVLAALSGDLSRLLPFQCDVSDMKCLAELLTRLITFFMRRIEEEAKKTRIDAVNLVPIMKILRAQYGDALRKLGLSESDLVHCCYVEVCLQDDEVHVLEWLLAMLKSTLDDRKALALVEDVEQSIHGNCIRTPSVDRLIRIFTQLRQHIKKYITEEVLND